MDDRCVCCGAYVPEGRQVCPTCELVRPNNRGGIKLKRQFYWGYYMAPMLLLAIAQIFTIKGQPMIGISISAVCGLWIGKRIEKQFQHRYGFVEALLFIRSRGNKPTAIPWSLIKTINIQQSLFGRLFRYGDVIVLFEDEELKLFGIKNPQQIRIEWFKQAAYKNYKGDVNYEND